MRGKISDQDLTDYALNELEPAQRLYVESMLAVSEECRNDVYEMIDLAMLLDQGFEREEAGQVAGELRPEQRAALLSVKTRPRQYAQRIAAVLAAAAVVTVAAMNPEFWQWKTGGAGVAKVAQVSKQVVVAAASSESVDFGSLLANWRQLADDPVLTKWFNSEWFDPSGQSTASAPAWDSMPRGGIEMMP